MGDILNAFDDGCEDGAQAETLQSIRALQESYRKVMGIPSSTDAAAATTTAADAEALHHHHHQQQQQQQHPHPARKGPHQRGRRGRGRGCGGGGGGGGAEPLDELSLAVHGVLEEHGGAAHFDTVFETLRARSADAATTTASATEGDAELRRALMHALTSSTVFYRSVRAAEGDTWMLASLAAGFASDDSGGEDDLEPATAAASVREVRYDSLAGLALRAVEDAEGGLAHADDIAELAVEAWARPVPALQSDEAVRQAVFLTLRTNPLFVEPPSNPGFYRLSDRCRALPRRWRCGARARLALARGGSGGDDQGGPLRRQRIASKRTRASVIAAAAAAAAVTTTQQQGPIVCYHCGATTPGRGPNARWKRGPKAGEAACLACHTSRPKKLACPICGKPYVQPGSSTASAASGDGERPAEDDEWIQCDECDRWIMTRCDKEIVDLSLYDDSNPNHLHYSCPLCRERKRQASPGVSAGTTTAAASTTVGTSTGTAPSSGTATPLQDAASGWDAPEAKRSRRGADDLLVEEAAFVADVSSPEEEIVALSERFDAMVADAARQSCMDNNDAPAGVALALSGTAQEELRMFKATLLKRYENTIHRLHRDHERALERVQREFRMQHADLVDEFVRQFRDHTDRLFSHQTTEHP